MLPTLYIGATQELLRRLPELIGPDASISISGEQSPPTVAEIRQLIGRLSWRPFHTDIEWWVLLRVDQLSEAAAAAVLKFLEEPPDSVRLILQAGTLAVLPTIRSRVRIEQLMNESVPSLELQSLLAQSLSDRLQTMSKLVESPDIVRLIQQWSEEARGQLSSQDGRRVAKLVLGLLPSLQSSSNKKLLLENFVLQLPSIKELNG